MYAPNMITLKQYYSSDVYSNCEKAKASGFYNNSNTININDIRKQEKLLIKPYSDGSYPLTAYEQIINNPPSLQIPDNDDIGYNVIRIITGVKYL